MCDNGVAIGKTCWCKYKEDKTQAKKTIADRNKLLSLMKTVPILLWMLTEGKKFLPSGWNFSRPDEPPRPKILCSTFAPSWLIFSHIFLIVFFSSGKMFHASRCNQYFIIKSIYATAPPSNEILCLQALRSGLPARQNDEFPTMSAKPKGRHQHLRQLRAINKAWPIRHDWNYVLNQNRKHRKANIHVVYLWAEGKTDKLLYDVVPFPARLNMTDILRLSTLYEC